ncbi:hypothetical protein [Paenibacillus donghaensis]|nr:hypothetical protein [Paenibacillus donghaensis]
MIRLEEGMTLQQIEDMDIGLYFRLIKRKGKGKAADGVVTGYIDQVL